MVTGLYADVKLTAQSRIFTAADGRVIEATIIKCDPANNRVFIQREGGRKIWVQIDIFSEADQAYIKEWIDGDVFMANAKLRVSVKKRKGPSSDSGSTIHYDVELDNRSEVSFENVSIDYRLYITERGYNGREDNDRCVAGRLNVGAIKEGGKGTFSTIPEMLLKDFKTVTIITSYDDGSTSHDTEVVKLREDRVEGIWLRINGPAIGETPLVRTITLPDDLEKKVSWIEKPAKTQVTSNGKKSSKKAKKSLEELLASYKRKSTAENAVEIGKKYLRDAKVRDLQQAEEWMDVAAKRGSVNGYNALALFYASSRVVELRDGEKAVKYALLVKKKHGRDDWVMDTLACAYARNGQFDLAVKTQEYAYKKAMKNSWSAKQKQGFHDRLQLFKQGKAWPDN
jgi:hypothetical protein